MKKIALALLMVFGVSNANAQAPKALLWKVSDADNSLYLLGSFHLLKETDYPLAKSTDAAFKDAEQLYFEVSSEEMSDPALGQKMAQLGTRTDGKTLQQSVSPETWKKFEVFAAEMKLPVANFHNFEPWFAGLVLGVMEMQKLGFNAELGVDKHFMARAKAANKPAKGLETVMSQFIIFDTMDAKAQEDFLLDALVSSADFKAKMEQLHSAWRNGEETTVFNKMAGEMREKYPALYKSLLPVRNNAWMPQLEALLKDNDKDDILVVVGAMHLVGDDGVIKMLRAKGYKVDRVN